ncbi:MAG TPA: DUF465 domain-containing protein [Desulfomonilaceae bacterium]|nr:DUF465 domain-containing protein [Desulfomonilaceae bacterium]
MEKKDLDLIAEWKDRDPELKNLWQEHLEYEEQLEFFNKRVYLSATEELERKTIQKKKLRGRDRIERILSKIRQSQLQKQENQQASSTV